MTTVILEYRRDAGAETSSGRILSNEAGLITEEGQAFTGVEFREMLKQLAGVLTVWPPEEVLEVVLQRTDREGLLPYKLDPKTVELLRRDPVAAIAAFEYPTQSPSAAVQRVQRDRVVHVQAPIRAGHAALSDSFGEQVYFKVRSHELECPGCGYWGMYISPGLLKDPERAGEVVKTAFVCPRKCKSRFIVTCMKDWGYVDVEYLLKQTKLDSFYFPRAWNEGRPWVSRETLQKMYDEYVAAKEAIPCSSTTE